MTGKSLAVSLFVLFALSAAYLFSVNERGLDPDQDKSWWSLAFAAPRDPNSLAFTITNHTNQSEFTYEASYTVTLDKIITSGDTVFIAPGESKTITPDLPRNPDFRTSITVTLGDEKQEIYR